MNHHNLTKNNRCREKAEDSRGVSMKKSIYLEDVTYRMLEYIAKRHNQSLPKFLTEWSLQEYKEHEKKPFHRNLKK